MMKQMSVAFIEAQQLFMTVLCFPLVAFWIPMVGFY